MWLGCGRTGEGCTRDYSKGCGGRGTGGSLEARGQSRGREGCGVERAGVLAGKRGGQDMPVAEGQEARTAGVGGGQLGLGAVGWDWEW